MSLNYEHIYKTLNWSIHIAKIVSRILIGLWTMLNYHAVKRKRKLDILMEDELLKYAHHFFKACIHKYYKTVIHRLRVPSLCVTNLKSALNKIVIVYVHIIIICDDYVYFIEIIYGLIPYIYKMYCPINMFIWYCCFLLIREISIKEEKTNMLDWATSYSKPKM